MLGEKINDYIESQMVMSSLMGDDTSDDSREVFGYRVLSHEFEYRNSFKMHIEHVCYFDGTGGSLRIVSLAPRIAIPRISYSQSPNASCPVKFINAKYLEKLDYSVSGQSVKLTIDTKEDEKNVLEILKELYENGNGISGNKANF